MYLVAHCQGGNFATPNQIRLNGEAHLDQPAFQRETFEESAESGETRVSPRYTLLIRVAKLICSQGEFICVIRDISSTGVSLRLLHALPQCDSYALEFQTGHRFEIRKVWGSEREGGFEFQEPINVANVIDEVSHFPKRGIRLGLQFPVTVATLTQRQTALVNNLSQQGARIELESPLAIDQSVRVDGPGLRDIRCKVRWRRGGEYGLVFDDTFTLAEFATLAARLQCPVLLRN